MGLRLYSGQKTFHFQTYIKQIKIEEMCVSEEKEFIVDHRKTDKLPQTALTE